MANPSKPTTTTTTTITTTTTTTTTTTLLPLPPALSPDALDILPHLSLLLSRLPSSTTNNPLDPSHLLSTSPPAPTPSPSNLPSSTNGGTLQTKDLPAATDDLKSKLQKAKLAVLELPDIERGVEEQEMEIRDWEARIKEQREAVEGLRGMGKKLREEREGRERDKRDKEGEKDIKMEGI